MNIAQLATSPLSEDADASSLDRHAKVVVNIQRMRDDLVATHEANDQLRVELQREQDKVEMLIEERNRWRAEALIFRSRLIELATAMSNIGLLTRCAEEIVCTVNELNNASSDALGKLEATFEKGNNDAAA
ncbi:hypothetical protein [Bradyrhizobium sp. USDA 10063]